MKDIYWEESWVSILAEQEKLLHYSAFTRETALALGLKILQLAQDNYKKPAAIRIVEDGMTIFSYKMAGTSSENDWWMDRKLAVSRMTGMSSLRSYVEAKVGHQPAGWLQRPDNFAACGGCIPVFPANNTAPWAHVLVSGMHHHEDHQIIADAMAQQLNIEIPGVL